MAFHSDPKCTSESKTEETGQFQEPLTAARLKQLLEHVVFDEQKEAEAIIKKNIQILRYKARVQDYSFGESGDKHREIEGTAYQMALGAQNIAMAKHDTGY